MTEDQLKHILREASDEPCEIFKEKRDNTLLGLNLIAKYLPNSGIGAACHDKIYACSLTAITKAGITENDAIQLKRWNWMEDEDSLACFV